MGIRVTTPINLYRTMIRSCNDKIVSLVVTRGSEYIFVTRTFDYSVYTPKKAVRLLGVFFF